MKISNEEQSILIAQWKSGTESKTDFCKRNNLSYHTFTNWIKKHNKEKSFGFIKINSPVNPAFQAQQFCEIHFTNGAKIIFHQQPNAAFIKQLL